ncbi:CpeT protein [Calothrix sp. NIES-4101]|nr:CpeT protein [Calothrix sp. NIES-4101]
MTISFNNRGAKTNTSDLITLTRWIAGDCSNQKQAFVNPTQYAHIHISFRPLPFDFFSEIGFYPEQVDDIQQPYCCSITFRSNPQQHEMFQGGLEPGNKCLIPHNGCPTDVVSEVKLGEYTWSSLDKGMDIKTHEQVWCSTAEPLFFEKKQSFADEISVSNVGETLC